MHRFYNPRLKEGVHHLSEEESRHCSLILRMKPGDLIRVLDGKGSVATCTLTKVSKNKCEYEIAESVYSEPKKFNTHLLIAPTKNADRMEWMIEKLCEVGVDQVTFLSCTNSERKNLRLDRLEKKAISAIKQSGNPYLPELNELTPFSKAIENSGAAIKLLAHVDQHHQYIGEAIERGKDIVISVGPEGDFTEEEVAMAKANGFQPISLGNNTLRTETAGLSACCFVNFVNMF